MPRVLPSTSESMRPAEIPPALRDDLLTYLFWTSPDRARITFRPLRANRGGVRVASLNEVAERAASAASASRGSIHILQGFDRRLTQD